jgi:hypothetical protein
MRSSPQVGFSATIRRISRLISPDIGGLPSGRDFQRQKRRKAARCQPINVAGFTITKALRHSKKRARFERTKRSPGVLLWPSSRVPEIRPAAYVGMDFRRPARSGCEEEQCKTQSSQKTTVSKRKITFESCRNTLNTSQWSHSHPLDFIARSDYCGPQPIVSLSLSAEQQRQRCYRPSTHVASDQRSSHTDDSGCQRLLRRE